MAVNVWFLRNKLESFSNHINSLQRKQAKALKNNQRPLLILCSGLGYSVTALYNARTIFFLAIEGIVLKQLSKGRRILPYYRFSLNWKVEHSYATFPKPKWHKAKKQLP